MSKKGHVYRLLEDIGMAPDKPYPRADREHLLKEQLKVICDVFDVRVQDMTTPEIRNTIREQIIGFESKKDPETNLSISELLTIRRKLSRLDYLDAGEVGSWEVREGQTVVINGEEYEVTESEYSEAHKDAAYERYYRADFGPRERLMILYGLDTNECIYDCSVVLEYAKNHGPYKTWHKKSYVEELDVNTEQKITA